MVTLARLAPPLFAAVIALGAGWLALLPGVGFWDTGEFQAVGPLLGTAHPTGFPTYVIIGWIASVVLQPLGEPAFRMNLLSAICVAVAAGVTVDLVRALTGSAVLGIAAGVAMALTPIAWAVATHAEAHALHLALIAIVLRLLVAWEARVRPADGHAGLGADDADRGDRYLVAAAIVYGLAAGNHSLTLLLAIPIALYVVAVDPSIWRRGRLVLSCVGALALTLVVVYLELPLRAGPFRAPLVYGEPATWDGFRYIVLAEQFQSSLLNPFGDLPRKLGVLVDRTARQFGILAPLIPFGFLATALRRPRYALLTGSAVAITCFFSASYVNADIGRYYLVPALIAWTWLAILAAIAVDAVAVSVGEAPLDAREGDWTDEPGLPDDTGQPDDPGLPAPAGAPRGVSRTAIGAAILAVMLLVPTLVAAPYRFDAVDASTDRRAARWVARSLEVMEPNAIVVSWWSFSTTLWYAQRVEGLRPDITIVDDRTRLDENLGNVSDVIDANLGTRPVYVIRIDQREVKMLALRYHLDYLDGVDATSLTRVVGVRNASS